MKFLDLVSDVLGYLTTMNDTSQIQSSEFWRFKQSVVSDVSPCEEAPQTPKGGTNSSLNSADLQYLTLSSLLICPSL